MSFIEEIRAKQKSFRDTGISADGMQTAILAIKREIQKVADDPFSFDVTELTIHYTADGNDGTCKFWTGTACNAALNPIFSMTVPQFQKVVDELLRMGFSHSAEYGTRSGHVKITW